MSRSNSSYILISSNFKIKLNIHSLKYQPTKPFEKFVNDLVEIRIASLGVNEALGTRAKFIMNSCVGRFGMDVARHKSTKFVTEKNLTRNIRTPLTERYENLINSINIKHGPDFFSYTF